MDSQPTTRRERKKTAKEKSGQHYSAKHVRYVEARRAANTSTPTVRRTK